MVKANRGSFPFLAGKAKSHWCRKMGVDTIAAIVSAGGKKRKRQIATLIAMAVGIRGKPVRASLGPLW